MSDVLIEPLVLSAPMPTSLTTETSKRDLERLDIAKRGYPGDKIMETVSLHRSMGQTLGRGYKYCAVEPA